MNVVDVWKHLERDVPGCHSVLRHEPDHLRLSFLKGSKITMEEFLEIPNRLAMAAVNERRRKRTQARETDHVFRERWKTS